MADTFERILAADSGVRRLYESHYLKANHPSGHQALWLKHTLLVRPDGPSVAEFWVVWFVRDEPPLVAKREVPLGDVRLDPTAVAIDADAIGLRADRCRGQIADVSWALTLSEPVAPLLHLPHAWMYTAPFPKAKLLTPAPRLRFEGELTVGSQRIAVDGWWGSRGHNWGRAHTHAYAYGNCQLWQDGTPRVIDGIAARVKLGAVVTPWLTSVVGEGPRLRRNQLHRMVGASTVTDTSWEARWRGRAPARLRFTSAPHAFVGLRYRHPDGAASYCYNTKFAHVEYDVEGRAHRSSQGELEILRPHPRDDIPLHPDPDWRAADGDYRSA